MTSIESALPEPAETVSMTLSVNGERYERQVAARRTLADFLREDLGLTGTHLGCEHGICGACTVILDGLAVRSWLILAPQVDGGSVTTVEGVGSVAQPHPIQEAFSRNHALQCGFCTPGFLMLLLPHLTEEPAPTRERIREIVSSNLCRCTGYTGIIDAMEEALADRASGESHGPPPRGSRERWES